jgi:hypothetical protein
MPSLLTPAIGKIATWLPRRPAPRVTRHLSHYERVLGTSLELQVVTASDDAAAQAVVECPRWADEGANVRAGRAVGSSIRRPSEPGVVGQININ